MKDKILKEFDEKYPNTTLYQVQQFHIGTGHTERRNILISGDIKDFLSKAIDQTREETIREIIGMCVNFDDYNNDQIISKEMLQELLNKLKK